MKRIIIGVICALMVGCRPPKSIRIPGVNKGIVQKTVSGRHGTPPYIVNIRTWNGVLVTDTLGAYEYYNVNIGDTIK